MIKLQKKNLKKQVKLIIFSLMRREKLIMISLAMQLLKEVEVEDKALVVLIPLLFQIFLKTFSVTLVEEVPQEDLVIEVMTLDMM